MSYPSFLLRELLVLHDSGVWGPEHEEDGISVLRSTNFSPDGWIRFDNLTYRNVELRKRASKTLKPNDIILEKSGGGPKQPVGRVCLFRGHHIAHALETSLRACVLIGLFPSPSICSGVYVTFISPGGHCSTRNTPPVSAISKLCDTLRIPFPSRPLTSSGGSWRS